MVAFNDLCDNHCYLKVSEVTSRDRETFQMHFYNPAPNYAEIKLEQGYKCIYFKVLPTVSLSILPDRSAVAMSSPVLLIILGPRA